MPQLGQLRVSLHSCLAKHTPGQPTFSRQALACDKGKKQHLLLRSLNL